MSVSSDLNQVAAVAAEAAEEEAEEVAVMSGAAAAMSGLRTPEVANRLPRARC